MKPEVIYTEKYKPGVEENFRISQKDRKVIEYDMRQFARRFLDVNFDLQLRIPIVIDGRLSSAGGSFHFISNKNKREALKIKMSERFVLGALKDEDGGIEAILDILSHELVHYALFTKGLPFSDGEPEFERKLEELGIGSSGKTNKDKRFGNKKTTWYHIVDVYRRGSNTFRYKHAKKTYDYAGERVEIRVERYQF